MLPSASISPLTVGQVAQFCGVDTWRVRRAVDALPFRVQRIGTYRIIERSQLPEITAELKRRGWLPESSTEATHAAS